MGQDGASHSFGGIMGEKNLVAEVEREGEGESPKEDNLPAILKNDRDFSGQLRLRIPKSLHAKLALMAEKEGVSLNMLLVHLLSGNHRELQLVRTQVLVQQNRQVQVNVLAKETKYVVVNHQSVDYFGAPTLYEMHQPLQKKARLP